MTCTPRLIDYTYFILLHSPRIGMNWSDFGRQPTFLLLFSAEKPHRDPATAWTRRWSTVSSIPYWCAPDFVSMLGKQLKSSLMMVQAEWLMVVQVGLSGWLRYYFAKGGPSLGTWQCFSFLPGAWTFLGPTRPTDSVRELGEVWNPAATLGRKLPKHRNP